MDGELVNACSYLLLGDRIVFAMQYANACRNLPQSGQWRFRPDYGNLNLPLPLTVGDLVTVDCTPFRPVCRALILEMGDNRNCCCVQALARNERGYWQVGALKHGTL